jgi:type I restriction enzyme S subunit
MESLTQETFLNYKLKLPNIKDQFNLVNNLEKSCERIDRLISLRQQIINKLDEYKKSLIYECVTGKKEIK